MGRLRTQEGSGVNMTPMIDVVFQMIIFFVCTAQLEKEMFSEFIRIPSAPNSPAMADEKDPRTITIEVDEKGGLSIARTRLSVSKLRKILVKTVAEYGEHGVSVPILIRADAASTHEQVRRVMDLCTKSGLRNIAFVAVKDAVKE